MLFDHFLLATPEARLSGRISERRSVCRELGRLVSPRAKSQSWECSSQPLDQRASCCAQSERRCPHHWYSAISSSWPKKCPAIADAQHLRFKTEGMLVVVFDLVHQVAKAQHRSITTTLCLPWVGHRPLPWILSGSWRSRRRPGHPQLFIVKLSLTITPCETFFGSLQDLRTLFILTATAEEEVQLALVVILNSWVLGIGLAVGSCSKSRIRQNLARTFCGHDPAAKRIAINISSKRLAEHYAYYLVVCSGSRETPRGSSSFYP